MSTALPWPPRKGDSVTMLFHYAGLTSEETYTALAVTPAGVLTIDNDEYEPSKCFRFDVATGRCLNDSTAFGAYRTLKLPGTAAPIKPVWAARPQYREEDVDS